MGRKTAGKELASTASDDEKNKRSVDLLRRACEDFFKSHTDKVNEISIYGPGGKATTCGLAEKSLARCGIEDDFGKSKRICYIAT